MSNRALRRKRKAIKRRDKIVNTLMAINIAPHLSVDIGLADYNMRVYVAMRDSRNGACLRCDLCGGAVRWRHLDGMPSYMMEALRYRLDELYEERPPFSVELHL